MTKTNVWRGVIDYFKVHRLRQWTHLAYMAYHYPIYVAYRMSMISDGTFRKPWPAHLGWYVRDYSIEEADQVWSWVVETLVKNIWRKDTCQILHQHRKEGFKTVLVSGTPVPLLERISREIEADYCIGTGLEIKSGRFTGRSLGPACIGEQKVILTRKYFESIGIAIDYKASYAYADSVSDKDLLEMVGNPVATYADEGLSQIASQRKWQTFPL